MKRFISFVLLFCILMVSTAFASVIEEIPDTAMPVDDGFYIVGKDIPSGSYTFCIDLNEDGVAEQVEINKQRDSATHEFIYADAFLYSDYKAMLDNPNNQGGKAFEVTPEENAIHIVLIDDMAMRVVSKFVSRAYLIPDKTE